MILKTNKLLVLFICLFFVLKISSNPESVDKKEKMRINSQICIASNNYLGNNYLYTWSLGGGVTGNISKNRIIISQGFHQPRLLRKKYSFTVNISVWPNPVIDDVAIQINNLDILEFRIEIYNMHGSKVYKGNFEITKLQHLSLKKYAPGVYVIKVLTREGGIIAIRKIIKL